MTIVRAFARECIIIIIIIFYDTRDNIVNPNRFPDPNAYLARFRLDFRFLCFGHRRFFVEFLEKTVNLVIIYYPRTHDIH